MKTEITDALLAELDAMSDHQKLKLDERETIQAAALALRKARSETERLRLLVRRLEAAGSELRASNERWGLTLRRRDASHAWSQAQVAAHDDLADA